MAYQEPSLLFEANEMSMENLMRGPVVEIIEDEGLIFGVRTFRSNKAGFQKYWPNFKKYGCTGLSVTSDDVAENRYFEEFDVDLNSINIAVLEHLELSGDTRFPVDFDYSVFSKMQEVRQLVTDRLSFGPKWTSWFPKLEVLLNFNLKANPIKSLNENWPNLQYVHLQGFAGDLKIFSTRDLRGIFLVNPSLKSFDDLLMFPNLETLCISGLRKGVDLAPLAKLPALRNLALHGKTKYSGWENFESASVEILELGWAPSKDVFGQFPCLQRGNISQMPGSSYGTGYNWNLEAFEYPFASVVPTLPI